MEFNSKIGLLRKLNEIGTLVLKFPIQLLQSPLTLGSTLVGKFPVQALQSHVALTQQN